MPPLISRDRVIHRSALWSLDGVAPISSKSFDDWENLESVAKYTNVHDSMDKYYNLLSQKIERERAFETRIGLYTDPSRIINATSTGDENFKRLKDGLDQTGLKRSRNQMQFHDAMLKATVAKCYGNEYSLHEERIKTEMNWDDTKERITNQVMISTPRRWGKTFSVAMFIAAFANGVRGSEQAVFSTGRRASTRLRDHVQDLLIRMRDLGHTDFKIAKSNVETLWLQFPDGSISKIFSYPSKAKISTFYLIFLFFWDFF